MKNAVKKIAPSTFEALKNLKAKFGIYRQALALLGDFRRIVKYMRWDRNRSDYWRLSAELIFQFHKIEKGLCIGGNKRFFGKEAAERTLELMAQWRQAGYSLEDPVYLGCHHAMLAYYGRLQTTPPPAQVKQALEQSIVQLPSVAIDDKRFSTPMPVAAHSSVSAEQFLRLARERRSVRWFSNRIVSPDIVLRAVEAAQLAPSACNRQPWRLHIYQERSTMDSLLALQNGNSGFGQQIPLLMAVCVDTRCFFDATERHEPYLDAGLFLMSLILALQAEGVGSCCLNWCVDAKRDLMIHKVGRIPDYEVVTTLLAVGYPAADAIVPRSVRRATDSVAIFH